VICCVDDPSVKNRLTECLETILNKAQEPPKSKKVQHSNAKNAVLFEAISLIIHMDSDPNLLVRGCNQLGQFLQHRETNLRSVVLLTMTVLQSFFHQINQHSQRLIYKSVNLATSFSISGSLGRYFVALFLVLVPPFGT